MRVRTLGLLTALLPAACASPPAGFDSPEPAARLAAITRAAEERDETAIPKLIEMLTSDDPVVRMAAIRTLERLTGTTMGYHYADPEWTRRERIREWVEWYSRQHPNGTPSRTGAEPGNPWPARRGWPIQGKQA